MKTTALADRFGSNRINAAAPGQLLRGCTCIAVPFAGGMCEIPHMTANIVVVNDLDRHVINLGRTVREQRQWLTEKLDATLFHPDEVKASQEFCKAVESGAPTATPFDPDWAYHYFICSWMTRGGSGGTDGEFDQGLSIRWKSGGGDSVVRFRSATAALAEWQPVMRKCTFTTIDVFDFVDQCIKRDVPENGLYVDAPWPEDGDTYRHRFTIEMQRRLAERLAEFEYARIVVRFGDHPLIRELYPESKWTWSMLTSRTQANKAKAEVLLTNWSPA